MAFSVEGGSKSGRLMPIDGVVDVKPFHLLGEFLWIYLPPNGNELPEHTEWAQLLDFSHLTELLPLVEGQPHFVFAVLRVLASGLEFGTRVG